MVRTAPLVGELQLTRKSNGSFLLPKHQSTYQGRTCQGTYQGPRTVGDLGFRRRPPPRRADSPLFMSPPRCLPRLSPGLRRSHGAVVPICRLARGSLPARSPFLPAFSARRSAAARLTKLSPTQAAWSYGSWYCMRVSLPTHLLPRPLSSFLTTKTTYLLTN